MTEVDIKNETTLEAVVNGPELVTLYHAQTGISVSAKVEDLPRLLAIGWREESPDPILALSAALLTLEAIAPALSRYAHGVIDDGVIDRRDDSAHFALFASVDAFSEALRELIVALEARYPRAEAAPVKMARAVSLPEGESTEEILVDPNQVEEFKAKGWDAA